MKVVQMWWFLGEDKTESVGSRGSNNTPTCECGKAMVLRQGRNGAFYECFGFPQCRKTKELNEVAEGEVKVEKIPVF
ncbi:MAG: topoisomerase DNA-binding C4 zinc finger domain-containing protein [bacterium]